MQFPLFPRLPVELQRIVWRSCLPLRVVEVDDPEDWDILGDHHSDAFARITICSLTRTTWLNRRPPVICRVCRLSRSVAFTAGDFVTQAAAVRKIGSRPPPGNPSYTIWKDRMHNSFYIDYNRAVEWDIHPSGRQEWAAETIFAPPAKTGNASMRLPACASRWAAQRYHRWGPSRDHFVTADEEIAGSLLILQALPVWLIVMRIFIVHCDLDTVARSGLFGLLGDAPVLVVDACREQARVKALLDFAEACESVLGPLTKEQNFELESPDAMAWRLEHHILYRYQPNVRVSDMHPAVMFRLCPGLCNRRTDKECS